MTISVEILSVMIECTIIKKVPIFYPAILLLFLIVFLMLIDYIVSPV